jgi:ABC-type lipoprotein export system ATPase subunit
MIAAMNDAEPSVFALMDYWTFNGWFELQRRLKQAGAPALRKTVFPGIELRLAAPTKKRLNAHVLFADSVGDQHLRDFLSRLKLAVGDRPLSEDALADYARNVDDDKLMHHGFKKPDILQDPAIALRAGQEIAEITAESYKAAITQAPEGQVCGFMPFSTYGGLGHVDQMEHYAFALPLFKGSPIFETRDQDEWAAFAGIETPGNRKFFKPFQVSLGQTSRLAVSGSDAHKFRGTANDNNNRGYGDFPSNKKTWIKADPTWLGLMQAIKEPAKRSYIGDIPPKQIHVNQNKTFYIDEVSIKKVPDSGLIDPWLDGCKLGLNPDLVAIIGNKGSGKSALADIIALLGHSQQLQHFSFLKRDRFRGKAGEPARQFVGTMTWLAGKPGEYVLSDDPTPDKVEMVKYIPQGRFEALCNDHVNGKSDAFENELRAVIFSHLDDNVRLGALNFDQLLEQQESGFRAKLNELRKKLYSLNRKISEIEDQLQPTVKINLLEQLQLKVREIDEHMKTRPAEVSPPADVLPPEQQAANERLAAISQEVEKLQATIKTSNETKQDIAARRQSAKFILDRLDILETQYQEFVAGTDSAFKRINIEATAVATLSVNREPLTNLDAALHADLRKLDEQTSLHSSTLFQFAEERNSLTSILNEPEQRYQKYLIDIKAWQEVTVRLEGESTAPESRLGLVARLEQIESLPDMLLVEREKRDEITKEIFSVLLAQTNARSSLFGPLQNVIQQNDLIREEYRLQFVAKLDGSPIQIATRLFDIVKQTVGDLRGEDESFASVKQKFERYQFESEEDAVGFTNDIVGLLNDAARRGQPDGVGIHGILRKDRSAADVYNYVFGLEYLEPRYTLLFQDTQIEQLSPGQRGALLLIFYLLVDRGRNPIVLDQPEENLDNETVVSLLVPVLNEAKKNRQIIMVTHNPNLAVVCDAEQIIYAEFVRKDGAKLSYTCGSIENGIINKHAVDVLEGTKRAFDNRRQKYH